MKKKIVLAVGAHPDDIDFGASGTIAKWVEEGAECYYLICTDGSRGSSDPKMTHRKLAGIRKKEQLAAGKVLGLKKVFFLNYTDTQLISDFSLKKDIAKIIKIVKPNILLTMDPTFYYSEKFGFVNHTDHRAASSAAMDACFPLSRDRLTFPDHEEKGLFPHKIEELWLVSFEKKKLLVDISRTFNKKIKTLACHRSQFDNFKEIEKRMTDRAKYFGKMKNVKFAENFTRIKMP